MTVQRITNAKQLSEFAQQHGLLADWHEPDNQGINARLIGTHLDNAIGPNDETIRGAFGDDITEFNVVLTRTDEDGTARDVAVVNLADLLGWAAAGYRAGDSLTKLKMSL